MGGNHILDTYSALQSPIHRAAAIVKLGSALLLVVITVMMPLRGWPWFVIAGALLIAVARMSRIPPLFIAMRMAFLEPFVLGAAMLTVFQPGGGWIFLAVVIKTTICLLAMILLANTTPFSELLLVLRRLRVPGLLITTLALMYRYLFIVLDEAGRMRRARRARTFTRRPDYSWSAMASVISRLFVRTSERSERIYMAMCARGWR